MTLEEITKAIDSRRKLTPEGETFEPMLSDEEMDNMEASLHHTRAKMIADLVNRYNAPQEAVEASFPKIPTKAELLQRYEERLRNKLPSGFAKWIIAQ
jgi:hypothetical protein